MFDIARTLPVLVVTALLCSCLKEDVFDPTLYSDAARISITVTAGDTGRAAIADGGFLWNPGDVINWVSDKGETVSRTLAAEDIIDGNKAVFTAEIPGLATGDVKGWFSYNSGPDALVAFSGESVASGAVSFAQHSAGTINRDRLFLASGGGYVTIPKGTATLELSVEMQGAVLAIRPFTVSYGSESVRSITVSSPSAISGTVKYDHSAGTSTRTGANEADKMTVNLGTEFPLKGVTSPELSSSVYFTLPAGTLEDMTVTVVTDIASYKVGGINDKTLSENHLTYIPVSLDKAVRKALVKKQLTGYSVSTNAPMQYKSAGMNADPCGFGSPDWFVNISSSQTSMRKSLFALTSNISDNDPGTSYHTNMDWGVPYSTWGARIDAMVGSHYIQVDFAAQKSFGVFLKNNATNDVVGDEGLNVYLSSDGSDFEKLGTYECCGHGAELQFDVMNFEPAVSSLRFERNSKPDWTGTGNSFGIAELKLYSLEEVAAVPVTGVRMAQSYITMKQGETKTVTANVQPATATDRRLSWTTSDSDVIRVDAAGAVTAVGAGTASVTATTVDGGFSASCTVSVTAEAVVSDNYTVSVLSGDEWKEVAVYDALCSNAKYHSRIWNDWNNSLKLRDKMSIALFENEFTGPVKLRIRRKSGKFNSCVVRPSSYGITPVSVDGSTVEITLPSYDERKVSVEFNGDRYHNLFVSGVRPDKDKPTASSGTVKYYGPGKHDAGKIMLSAGQTLYVDTGAIVYGEVTIGGNNCTIAGHGIISGEKLPHTGDTYATGAILIDVPSRCDNLTFRDVTILDSPNWTLRLRYVDGALIDGVNIITWILNGDGIDIVSSRNVEVRNCLLRTYDDCISMKVMQDMGDYSDTRDVNIHDNLIWCDLAHGVVVGPECGNNYLGGGYIHDITVRDCVFMEHVNSETATNAAFAIYQKRVGDSDNSTDVVNVTASDLLFDSINGTGRNIYIGQNNSQKTFCTMSNVILENITIKDDNAVKTPACTVASGKNYINGLHIRNFVFAGSRITAPGTNMVISGYVDYTIE